MYVTDNGKIIKASSCFLPLIAWLQQDLMDLTSWQNHSQTLEKDSRKSLLGAVLISLWKTPLTQHEELCTGWSSTLTPRFLKEHFLITED